MQLLPALDAGGVERSTLEIARALVAAGHRALVVSAGGAMVPALEAAGAVHIRLEVGRKTPLVLRHVPALRRLLRQHRVDILHARSRLPAWVGRLALRGMPDDRPRWVTTVHGLNSPGRYSAVMASGERVICVSDTVRAHVREHYPQVDPARLAVVPRGVDPAAFPRSPLPAAGEPPLLLMPGRGTRLKGHADAIALLAELTGRGRNLRLWLLGAVQPGRERYLDELRAQAAAAGVSDRLLLSPPVADVRAAYAQSHLVLQLSRKPEAFGRTVLEALCSGRPAVGWDHGGVGEVLSRLYPAGRVPVGELATLADRVTALLDAPPPPPDSIPYTLQSMQDATLRLYEHLLDH